MNKILLILLCLLLGTCYGCSSSPEDKLPKKPSTDTVNLPEDFPTPPAASKDAVAYIWERSAIHIETYSTSLLNMYNDKTHNLMLCVYQLSDMKSFQNLLDQASNVSTGDAMRTIVSCKNFDESVITTRRLFVRPKNHKLESFDREKDVRFIALVAGYNNNLTTANVIVREIPIKYARTGMVFKNDEYSVAELNMRLFVGKDKIQDLRDGETFEFYQLKENEDIARGENLVPQLSGGSDEFDAL
jgi:predicted component of type VI protein secretion system